MSNKEKQCFAASHLASVVCLFFSACSCHTLRCVLVLTSALVLARGRWCRCGKQGCIDVVVGTFPIWRLHNHKQAHLLFRVFNQGSVQEGGVRSPTKNAKKKSLETQIFQKAATHPFWVSSSKTSCKARFSQPIAKPPRQTWFAGHPNGFSLVGLSNIRSVPRKHWKSFRETWAYQLPKITICHPLFPCIPTGSYLGMVGKFSTLTTTSGWKCNKIYKKTNVTHLPKPVSPTKPLYIRSCS